MREYRKLFSHRILRKLEYGFHEFVGRKLSDKSDSVVTFGRGISTQS